MRPDQVLNVLIPVQLVVAMIFVGLKVKFADMIAASRRTRLVVQGLLANYVVVPLLTAGLLLLLRAQPLAAVGFLILAVCPGAPLGPPLTVLAKGDVAFAIGLMVLLAALSVVLTPLLLALLLSQLFPELSLQIDVLHIGKTLLLVQLLPLTAGLAVHEWAVRLAARLVRPMELLCNLLLLVVVALALVSQFETLIQLRLAAMIGMPVLFVLTLGIGWLAGGPGGDTRRTMALTTVSRNVGVGLLIASKNFGGTLALSAVLVYALVLIVGGLLAAVLWGKRGAGASSASPGHGPAGKPDRTAVSDVPR
jgi:BASS family bile acid:Na+ symporter